MGIKALTAILMAAAGPAAHAGHKPIAFDYCVTVCTDIQADSNFSLAHLMAADMFARIGAKLVLRSASGCSGDALQVSLFGSHTR